MPKRFLNRDYQPKEIKVHFKHYLDMFDSIEQLRDASKKLLDDVIKEKTEANSKIQQLEKSLKKANEQVAELKEKQNHVDFCDYCQGSGVTMQGLEKQVAELKDRSIHLNRVVNQRDEEIRKLEKQLNKAEAVINNTIKKFKDLPDLADLSHIRGYLKAIERVNEMRK